MYSTMKEQNFGVEIELTGITRARAAEVIAEYFGTRSGYDGTYYQVYTATDSKGRKWKAMYDGSIHTECKINGRKVMANMNYSCEVVTPILQYEDMEDLQNVVRALRSAGAFANSSCGIHVHVGAEHHTNDSIVRLLGFAVGRQDLFYEALEIGDRANRWCKKMSPELLKAMKNCKVKTMESIEGIWYSEVNDGYYGGIDHEHYNPTRYHGINLHAYFTKKTVEFRLFNSTTHAGKIKAYIQFCLAMNAWSIECETNRISFRSCKDYTAEQKADLMYRVLAERLGLSGDEFKTCRQHLTAAFKRQAQTDTHVA